MSKDKETNEALFKEFVGWLSRGQTLINIQKLLSTDEETIAKFNDRFNTMALKCPPYHLPASGTKKGTYVCMPVGKLAKYVNSFSPDIFTSPENNGSNVALPFAIKQFQVENYKAIKKTSFNEIPVDTQWIFLTGKNGFGKTILLEALVIGLFGIKDGQKILVNNNDCFIEVEFKEKKEDRIKTLHNSRSQSFKYFAAYGATRLQIQYEQSQNDKSTPTYNLFHTDGILKNIESKLVIWNLEKDPRYQAVCQLLTDLMPNVQTVSAIKKNNNWQVEYIESNDENTATYEPMSFRQIASGYKSIIAMIGDMLIRFYELQPDIVQPSELAGIVIIDELDLHMHPIWQRKLPSLLSKLFPKIQFIASTHSPIPILGAPRRSVFLKVIRTKERDIEVLKLDDLEVRNLTPNTILSSPIFDFEALISEAHNPKERLRTENTYAEIVLNDEMRKRLKKVAARLSKNKE